MAKTGVVVGVAAIGGLMIWSGVSNAGVLASIRDVIQGNAPVPGADQFTAPASGEALSSTEGVDGVGGSIVAVGGTAGAVVAYAVAQVGKPYIYAGVGPNGYDCSGLIWAAYKSVGISIPRTTYVQIVSGQGVPIAEAQPGDLLFPNPGHVYMNIGPGMCVEAHHTGTLIDTHPYDSSVLIAVRRFL